MIEQCGRVVLSCYQDCLGCSLTETPHHSYHRAIKVGAERIYVSTRQGAGDDEDGDAVSWTTQWPYNKVEILEHQIPIGVTEDGKCIQFGKVEWEFPSDYVPVEEGAVETELRDIDTVIFCTGYLPNYDMLDESLREAVKTDVNMQVDIPKDWKMAPNKLTDIIGEVEPGDVRWCNSFVGYPGLYRGMSIENPNMMFIMSPLSSPLCGIDVLAWLLVKFVTGQREIPSKEEMIRQNISDAMHDMDSIEVRYRIDGNYYKAYEDHFEQNPHVSGLMTELYEDDYERRAGHDDIVYYRQVARMMREADYPVDYGTYDDLSKVAATIIHYNELSYYHRYNLKGKETWRTFRDYTDGDQFVSIFTGQQACNLKERWLDIDATDESILES